ncbi:galactose-binding domain-containing protein [Rhizobium sp. N541]|uniref:hypothetical protein n=1 Tax=unclassified Rhizobium TaxID=2613769 RepID=UPI0007EE70FF|nr:MULTISPECIES: hypothetical protein [unclassified Rhizobium]ANM17178.1 galactose-binding domain-containing protein [Rhizobium sp. N541]ANM23563.1 galactose-binding domain-containing protein [Rhizobium sp. N941]
MGKLALLSTIMILFAGPAIAQTCHAPSDTASVVTNDEQRLSLAYNVSSNEWDEENKNFGAAAVIYGVPVSANYDEYKRKVREQAQQLNINSLQRHFLAYVTSTLTQNDLDAYKACLAQGNSLTAVTESIGPNTYIFSLVASPSFNPSVVGLRLASSTNLSSNDVAYLNSEFNRLTTNIPINRQFTITPSDKRKEVTIDIAAGSLGVVLQLPALDVPAPTDSRRQISIAAASFDQKANVGTVPAVYGDGVILNTAAFCNVGNMAHYTFAAAAGRYSFWLQYASGSPPRPVTIDINGVTMTAGNTSTGGFTEDHQKWFKIFEVDLKDGVNTLRLSRPTCFPHIKGYRFVPS